MLSPTTNDAEALALNALAATLSDERRARRFLDLTGLSPDGIRDRIGERSLLASALTFLENHEPDLIEVARVIGCKPGDLIAARTELEQ